MNAPGRRRLAPAALVAAALVGLIALVTLDAIDAGAETTSAPASRPTVVTDTHRPVTLDLVQVYLKRWNVEHVAFDRRKRTVQFQLLVNRRTRLNCVIQVKTKKDGVTFDRLYIGFVDLVNLPDTHPRATEVLRLLATLNWNNALGKYSWDPTDGEVRLEYTLLASHGLCHADFADALNRLSLIADHDLPALKRLVWR